ncbi:hypothetical protein SAMN05444395_101319 [Flavobacterium fryxellicola]|uniref:Magnesium citrate secondary transporter n=2 Tax=Flavobacterium fryxellicola TaxID=249352 RepID=A0A167XPJ3_9FLAO|nr:hypothetical protein FBFR_07695 [Flavobacterium fryxellicola]SHN51935.1 hypothetical protein SAMN05444395_101319 [Flavobacterium fryxellicola]
MFIIALTIYVLQQLSLPLPSVINNYANDLFCLPLVLGAMEFTIRRLKKDKYFKFPIGFVILLSSYYSFYFEYYLPSFNSRYTADWVDVILYFLGGLTFYFSENKKGVRLSEEGLQDV